MRLGAMFVSALLAACSGGGGSSSFKATATLLSVEFLDPNDVNSEAIGDAPQSAPLTQQIRFTFSGDPDPNRINSTVLPILDASNLPVLGWYDVVGPIVTFTPSLPTRSVTTTANGALDDGGAGLDFNGGYSLRVGHVTFSFVADVLDTLQAKYPDPVDPDGIFIRFRTMPAPTADAFRGIESKAPNLIESDPLDGAIGVSPNLYSDPDQLFAPRRAFTLTFNAPINPDVAQLNDTVFQLVDLDDRPALFPLGVPLGVDVRLLENSLYRAVVEVSPSGILPLGHLLALQYDVELKGLSETGIPAGGPAVAATFTVAADPGGTIHDIVVEEFDDNVRQELGIAEIGNGNLPADWSRNGLPVLQAALEFDGTGAIGRFKPGVSPTGDTNTIVLDTSSQVFPLLDGSTPDAPPGYIAIGGVFDFTEIDIPRGVEIKVTGDNPLTFKCTGTVRIGGDIFIHGEDGANEYGWDSAITSIPGGHAVAGGGTGGESHPLVFYPPDQLNYLTLVSPSFAGIGFGIDPADGVMKRIGGTGAQCGILDQASSGKYQTDNELSDCGETREGNGECRIAGGGGGSMLRIGLFPQTSKGVRLDGIGNVVADGTGRFILDVAKTSLPAGEPGAHPFAPDGTSNNNYYGKLGQLQRLIGGQGGGGGGTLTDSYYCGTWCDLDSDPANDGCCNNDDLLPQKGRAPSVGDSRGGGGGGGGGCFIVKALGAITLISTGAILANGGDGGGGEGVACSYWGGGGGGGAGGMVVFQSSTSILIEAKGFIDVRRGVGEDASDTNDYAPCVSVTDNIGDGGLGGHGLIQLQVPAGQTATVTSPGTTDTNGSIRPPASWIDPTNTMAPVEFTSISVALSKWFDVGRVIKRSPVGTNPVFSFTGTGANGGVLTDLDGNVLSPESIDIDCGYLGQFDPIAKTYLPGEEPRAEFVPPNATVVVEFQGADALVPGAKEVDPATVTGWSGEVAFASGHQFIRWRVTFNLTADGSVLSTLSRRPVIERVQVHAEF